MIAAYSRSGSSPPDGLDTTRFFIVERVEHERRQDGIAELEAAWLKLDADSTAFNRKAWALDTCRVLGLPASASKLVNAAMYGKGCAERLAAVDVLSKYWAAQARKVAA
jgi:hypothetical protein